MAAALRLPRLVMSVGERRSLSSSLRSRVQSGRGYAFRAGFHTSPVPAVKRYERRYGPAAGVDLSEAKKKDAEQESQEAARRKEKTGKPNESNDTPSENSSDTSQASKESGTSKDVKQKDKDGDPLETIFQIPEPTTVNTDSSAEPIQPLEKKDNFEPKAEDPDEYVHHFDTYTLVKNLQHGGFSEEQSISIMKGIRGALSDHLRSAKNELMSKSQIENDSYLFKAASEELRNSIMVARASEIESQRTRRAQLQHELDILAQRLNQDFSRLKDDLKEMFNNQKISTRESQRSIDTAIQELNYQITVSLNSDGKSEVEGLRWILTRRAALAIAISACQLSPTMSPYSTY